MTKAWRRSRPPRTSSSSSSSPAPSCPSRARLGLGPGDLAEGVVVGLVQAPAEQLQPLGDQRLLDRSAGLLGGLGVAERKATATRATRGTRRRGGPAAGLAEIGRVLRPDARALIWDFRPGVRSHPFGPRHAMALAMALAVQPHPAGRAGPRRWVTLVASPVACNGGHSGTGPPPTGCQQEPAANSWSHHGRAVSSRQGRR
jgi:hypothetical protein